PEELIEGNQELWDFVSRIESSQVVSKNKTFHLVDKERNNWLLKVTDCKEQACLEAAANYYLSGSFDFIVPGRSPEPIAVDGLYITMQKDVSDEKEVRPSLDYWLSSLALFHRDAERILRENGVDIRDIQFRSAEEEKERYLAGRRKHELKFNQSNFEDCLAYLRESSYKTLIHNDTKKDNLHGRYLVDLELLCIGNPGIDLAMLLMNYGLPQQQWSCYLKRYLQLRNVGDLSDQELKQLNRDVKLAAYLVITREKIASSLRVQAY
ncbi:MAG: phosphotransferase, partial [Candidatus Woesearchaeota archaeon]